MSTPSATIKIFLVHGDPQRLRTAEMSNWTGKAVSGPRNDFDEIMRREESAYAGVYFLTGYDIENDAPAIYIGKAESVRKRVPSHMEKDFWNHITFFTSSNDSLTSSHALYLEGRLIEQAKQAGRATTKNSQSSGAKLPESDRADMEIFLEKIHQLLPLLGVDAFIPKSVKDEDQSASEKLFAEIHGLKATAYRTSQGFLVLKGSQAVLKERGSISDGLKRKRSNLQSQGILVIEGDFLRFTKDTEFSTPSAAASVIRGGNSNGLISWKNENGTQLRDIESPIEQETPNKNIDTTPPADEDFV